MPLPMHILEALQLRVLEDINKRLEDLPERIVEAGQRRSITRFRREAPQPSPSSPDESSASSPSAKEDAGPPYRAIPGRWAATERLLGSAGAFAPVVGQIGSLMRSLREFHEATSAFLAAWVRPSSEPVTQRSPAFVPPRVRPPKRHLPIPGAEPIRVYPRPVPWANEDEMLPLRRKMLPRVIDQQGNPVLPRTPLPGPSVPLLEDRRAATGATSAAPPAPPPAIPPGVPPPGSAPARTTSLPPGGSDPFAEWRRALNVDLNDPDAYEVDINTGELTLPGQDTPPLTGTPHGAGGATSERLEGQAEKLIQIGEQIVRALEEEEANEDGGTPSGAEREQGSRRSMWESEAPEPRGFSLPSTSHASHGSSKFPGRPAHKPKSSGLIRGAIEWLEDLI